MRVLTMFHLNGKEVYQTGTYEGMEPYPGIGNTDMTRDNPDYSSWGNKNHKNPKITLDDGKVIWGCECWWWQQ